MTSDSGSVARVRAKDHRGNDLATRGPRAVPYFPDILRTYEGNMALP